MRRAAIALAVVVPLAAAGCAGSALESEARNVRQIIKSARDGGAYRCAPRELALAETHTEFAEREIDQGDYFRAREHLRVADESAREAVRLSPRQRCAPVAPQRVDSDGDGLADNEDKCPKEPEDKDEFEDEDGCPELDNDQDGVADAKDACPKEPEDKDGFQDEDGCAEGDNDQDGLADASDKCPLEAEDRDGFQDDDGCPDPDNDNDTIADASDKCPNEAGPPGGDGCPKKFEHIVVTTDKIELKQKIFFQTNKATIMARSFSLLNEVAEALRTRATMKVRIEGHTDSRGTRKRNVKLSQDRADSVRAYLTGHGIDASRMEAQGYGPDQPIETNKTAAGREKNRRVEFVITQQ